MAATTPGLGSNVSRQVDPPAGSLAVTPDDDTDLEWVPRAIYIGVGGDVRLWLSGDDTTNASGTLTIDSGSGAVGGTFDGTTVTVVWATSDIATATALAAAINADVTVSLLGSASNLLNGNGAATNVVTFTYKNPAPAGDTVTFVATGTGVTASGSGTLAGSAGTRLYQNMLSGMDYPRVVRRVMAEDTTATGIIALR